MQGMVPLSGFGGVPYSAVRKAAPRNILDNSDFTNLVAQAGIGGTHGTIAYAADRWILDSGTVSYEAGVGLTLNGTIRQKLEFPPTGETSAFVGMASGAASISYADGAVTITSSGGVLKWAALYGGVYTETTKPEYQPKGYVAELAECQRYYYRFQTYWKHVAIGFCTDANTAIFVIKLPQSMRVIPTLTISNMSKITVRCGGGRAQVPGNITANQSNIVTDTLEMTATVTGATTGDAAVLYLGENVILSFSADL